MQVEVKNITKTYTQGEETISALSNVELLLKKGDFVAITGRSGSGKSTLLNIIAGLTAPTSGVVLFDDKNFSAFSDAEASLFRNSKIGCVPQVPSLLSGLNILDNVRLPFHLCKREGDSAKKAYHLLSMVGLEKLANRMPKRLSGGQVKRVAIARAMINKPELMLLDEPTGDLDSDTTGDMMKIFKEAAQEGTIILMVTHDTHIVNYANKHFTMGNLSSQNKGM